MSCLSWRGRLLNQGLRVRTLLKPPRQFPSYLRPFGGTTWWNLSRPAVDDILAFLADHPDYRRYHQYTKAPDEIFFQSIVGDPSFSARHGVINDALRYLRWGATEHPLPLTTADLPAMLDSGKLFARKLDASVDGEILEALTARLGR